MKLDRVKSYTLYAATATSAIYAYIAAFLMLAVMSTITPAQFATMEIIAPFIAILISKYISESPTIINKLMDHRHLLTLVTITATMGLVYVTTQSMIYRYFYSGSIIFAVYSIVGAVLTYARNRVLSGDDLSKFNNKENRYGEMGILIGSACVLIVNGRYDMDLMILIAAIIQVLATILAVSVMYLWIAKSKEVEAENSHSKSEDIAVDVEVISSAGRAISISK